MACSSRKSRLELAASRQRTAPLQQGSQTSGTIFNLVTASGTISYALDVFGGERRTVEGLRAQADSQRYETKAAYLTLSANVVNTSIARAAYAAQIRATEQLIELENQQLHLTEAQVRAGTAPYSTVLSVRSLIAANQASLAPLEAECQPGRAPAGDAGRRGAIQGDACPTSTWPDSRCRLTCR